MKTKTLLSVLVFGFILSAFGQKPTMELTFTAENNGQYIPLDSIFIENLTQGGDTTLYAPDTVLSFEYSLGINKIDLSENSFSISQNYPNSFKGKTEVNLFLPEKEYIKITVRNLLGIELVQYKNTLNRGNQYFTFYSGNETYYLLTVSGKQTSKTIKMLNKNSYSTYGEECKIVYNEHEDNVIGFKSHKAINNFVFNTGDELQYTGYANSLDNILGSDVIADAPQANTNYEFVIIKGIRCPGTPSITDIDGNLYNTVLIGSQCWMAENLKTTTYKNGTAIPNVTDANAWSSLTTGAYVWWDNDISWKGPYGALYNWYAVVDPNRLCLTGWHIPSDDEWTALTDFIGGTSPPNGGKLKSCHQVNSPLGGDCNTADHPRWEEHYIYYGTDDFGFSGLPGGYREFMGTFTNFGYSGNWWSATGYSPTNALNRSLGFSSGEVYRIGYSKGYGFSVRCIRD